MQLSSLGKHCQFKVSRYQGNRFVLVKYCSKFKQFWLQSEFFFDNILCVKSVGPVSEISGINASGASKITFRTMFFFGNNAVMLETYMKNVNSRTISCWVDLFLDKHGIRRKVFVMQKGFGFHEFSGSDREKIFKKNTLKIKICKML